MKAAITLALLVLTATATFAIATSAEAAWPWYRSTPTPTPTRTLSKSPAKTPTRTSTATRTPATATRSPATATRSPATATPTSQVANQNVATATKTPSATATRSPATATRVPATATASATTPPPTATPTTAPVAAPVTISNPSGPCLVVDGKQNVTLQNLVIGPCGGEGIVIRNSSNVTISNVTVSRAVANISILSSTDVSVTDSTLKDPQGPKPRGQQVIIDKSSRVTIARNTATFSGDGYQEDGINAYMSDQVMIDSNSVTGGNSTTGCGIMVDMGSTNVTIRNNTVRHQANCGIGVAAGYNHLVEGNNVADYGFAGTGKVGIYVWNQSPDPCHDITVRGNTVGPSNAFWGGGGNCANLVVVNNIW